MSNLNNRERSFRFIRGLLNPRPEWEQKKTSGNRSMPFRQDNEITNPVWKVGGQRERNSLGLELSEGKGKAFERGVCGCTGSGRKREGERKLGERTRKSKRTRTLC